jgi:DNA end-binding protein Ku
MIKEKLKGHKPVVAAAPERGNVINLMDALKASLGQGKPPAESKPQAKKAAPPAKAAPKTAANAAAKAAPKRKAG